MPEQSAGREKVVVRGSRAKDVTMVGVGAVVAEAMAGVVLRGPQGHSR